MTNKFEAIIGEKQNVFILTLAVLSFASVISLSALGESNLAVYTSVLTIVYFGVSLVLQVRRRAFDFLGVALFIIFALSIASSVI